MIGITDAMKTMKQIEEWEAAGDYEAIHRELPGVTDIVYVTKENAMEMAKSFINDVLHLTDTATRHSALLNKLQESKQKITKSNNGGQKK